MSDQLDRDDGANAVQCDCICGCKTIATNPDQVPYLCSTCYLREMRGDGEFHHLRRTQDDFPDPIGFTSQEEYENQIRNDLLDTIISGTNKDGYIHRSEIAALKVPKGG